MSNIQELIRRKAEQYGVDPAMMTRIAQIESSLNPRADNGKYRGLYQFGQQEWKDWGKGDIFDPEANVDAAARRMKNLVMPAIDQATEGKSDPHHYYLGWQQGVSGGPALIANPNQPAAETLAPFYGNGDPMAGLKMATSAVTRNGGGAGWTGKDFIEHWKGKYNGVPDMPPTQYVSGDAPPASGPAGGLLGGTPPEPNIDAEIANWSKYGSRPEDQPKSFNNAGLMATGMQTMAMGAPQQPEWMTQAMKQKLPAYRPEAMGLLSTDDPRRRRGLLGM